MRMITLWQPWCSLLFEPGYKTYETRKFSVPKSILGTRVAFHAAKDRKTLLAVDPFLDAVCKTVWGDTWKDTLIFGAVLGTAIIESCEPSEVLRPKLSIFNFATGDWSDGRFGWRLVDPRRFETPVFLPGKQGWGHYADPHA